MLQVSDLFKSKGRFFDYSERVKDQDMLVQRLRDLNDEDLSKHADDIDEFTQSGIASIVYLEYMLEKITKTCSQKNIGMS